MASTARTVRQKALQHAGPTLAAARVKDLLSDLSRTIDGEVRFDPGSRALYSTDASNYRQVPIGVVIPKHTGDVIQTVAACRSYGAPILARGGGTSLAGQTCNVAVIIDFSKYIRQILSIDVETRRAVVQPGVVLDELRNAAEQYHLTFAPDPATHNHCTLGGMIGNNSCGVHSVMGGRTSDNVVELDILTYDGTRLRVGETNEQELERIITAGGRRGEIYSRLKSLRDRYADQIRARFPNIPRRVSGYPLEQLLPEHNFNVARALAGTENTCVTVLEATLRLVYSPPKRSLLVLGYPDIYSAGDHIMEVLAHQPTALEGMDDRLVEDMEKMKLHPKKVKLLPPGGGWLLVEFGGKSKQEADDKARGLMDELEKSSHAPSMKLFDNLKEERMIWTVRESGLGATANVPGESLTWEGWEDSAVPPDKVGDYLREFRKLLDRYNYRCDLYGHFGQGCIHTRIDFDLETAEGIRHFRSFLDEAADTVVRFGGSLSGEHGDGQSRAELLPKMYGEELVQAFREFKSIWDPDWRMNPGKVVDPYQITENLRLGTNYNPPQVTTGFKYPDDNESFSRAALRCVGVGECRKLNTGTMCPSYMVTMEEMHSTRGRARLIFEMLEDYPLTDRWRNKHVRDALDLCLSCKGCLGDCPVHVDMATYKAEFLSHYYQGRIRPVTAYTMGLIYWWSRVGARMPGVANFVSQTPGLRRMVKTLGGIAQGRQIPAFAPQTFKQWFKRRGTRNLGLPQVILWPDTFNNHFHPEVAKAAVEVIEDAGFQPVVPEKSLCCGRPLYDYGMLNLAKSLLRQVLDELGPQIAAGIPVIGLEPSCAAVFRNELINLFPNEENAKRLSQQTYLLSEFLEDKASGYRLPQLQRKAMVQGHCHHAAVMQFDAEERVLSRLGLDYSVLDSGCCGMAGSFGFEADHYDISIKVGERVLLPAVRDASKDTLIIANGFSCQEQILQKTDRRPLHLAQVIHMAMHEQLVVQAPEYPETSHPYISPEELEQLNRRTQIALGAGAAVTTAALTWALRSRSQRRQGLLSRMKRRALR